MAVITAAFTEIQRRVSVYLGYGRSAPTVGTDEEADINDAIREGLRSFYHCGHPWKYLKTLEVLTTTAPYSTGTVAVAPGGSGSVVTLTGGTFAVTVNDNYRLRTGGDAYDVSSWVSSTSLLLVDTDVTVAAGAGYELGRPYYDLPTDFAGFHGKQHFTYAPGTGDLYGPIPVVDESLIRIQEEDFDWSHRPLKAALRPKDAPGATVQLWQVQLWPVPDARYRLAYRYVHDPEMLDTTVAYHWGGTPYSRAIILACLAAAEEHLNDGSTQMRERFEAALQMAIQHDRQANAPDSVGMWVDPSDRQLETYPTREEFLVDYRQSVPAIQGF